MANDDSSIGTTSHFIYCLALALSMTSPMCEPCAFVTKNRLSSYQQQMIIVACARTIRFRNHFSFTISEQL